MLHHETHTWLCQFSPSNRNWCIMSWKALWFPTTNTASALPALLSPPAATPATHGPQRIKQEMKQNEHFGRWSVTGTYVACAPKDGRHVFIPSHVFHTPPLCGAQPPFWNLIWPLSPFQFPSFRPRLAPPFPSTAPLIFIEANASCVIFLLCGPLMRFCQVNLSDKAGALICHPSSVPASTFLFSTATSLITGFVATLSQFSAYKLLTLSFCWRDF